MDRAERHKALRMISNGMYILTSHAGDRYGAATVTWLSQASFQPPLIMAAVGRDRSVLACLAESRVAAVHILGAHQQDLARRFFAHTRTEPGTLNGEPFSAGRTSAPILASTPAYLECEVRHILESGGDHVLVVMEVVEAVCRESVEPLTIASSPWEYGG